MPKTTRQPARRKPRAVPAAAKARPPRAKPRAGPEPKPPSRGELTRTHLLDAAFALFMENGYHGTSMRQVADRAGVTLGGIYNHYDGKEAIFLAVLKSFHPYHGMLAALAGADGADADSFFRSAAAGMLDVLKQDPRILNLMLIELVEFEGKHVPELAGEIFPRLLASFSRLQAFAPELRPLPPPLLLRTFFGLLFSYYVTDLLLARTPLGKLKIDWFDGMVDTFLYGVLKPAPGAPGDPEA